MYQFGNNSFSEKSFSLPLLQAAKLMIGCAIFILLCNIHVPWVLFLDALIESASLQRPAAVLIRCQSSIVIILFMVIRIL